MSYHIKYYKSEYGKIPFSTWVKTIKDKNTLKRIRVTLIRAKKGNLGSYKRLSNGIFEFKIAFGPGYRIYFAFTSTNSILILWGGTKQTQKYDMIKAANYYSDYKKKGIDYA